MKKYLLTESLFSSVDTSTIDWDERYHDIDTNDKDALKNFWQEYYTKVWGNAYGNIIQQLGDDFIYEVTELGFNDIKNPFISFINEMVVTNKLDIDFQHYSVLHNEYVKGRALSEKDLRGNGLLKKMHIIFCKDLYAKSKQDRIDYIEAQQLIQDSYTENTFPKTAFAGSSPDGLKNFLLSLFYANQVNDIFTDLNAATILAKLEKIKPTGTEIIDKKLTSINYVDKLIKILFNITDKAKNNKVSFNIALIRSHMKTPEEVIKMIIYLLIEFMDDDTERSNLITDINSTTGNKYASQFTSISLDMASLNTFKKLFKSIAINASNIKEIIKEIAKTLPS